jgi:hypothetical protein
VRGLGIAVAVLTLVSLGASAGRPPYAQLSIDDYGGSGVGFHDTRPNAPYLGGDVVTCLDRPGRVVIERVEPIKPTGGLTVTGFAVIPNGWERGSAASVDGQSSLARRGLAPAGPVVVDKPCPDFARLRPWDPYRTPVSVILVVEYSKALDETADHRGLMIHYVSGGRRYRASVAWQFVLCAPGDTTRWGCRGAS